MKKISYITLLIIITILFCGCKQNGNDHTESYIPNITSVSLDNVYEVTQLHPGEQTADLFIKPGTSVAEKEAWKKVSYWYSGYADKDGIYFFDYLQDTERLTIASFDWNGNFFGIMEPPAFIDGYEQTYSHRWLNDGGALFVQRLDSKNAILYRVDATGNVLYQTDLPDVNAASSIIACKEDQIALACENTLWIFDYTLQE